MSNLIYVFSFVITYARRNIRTVPLTNAWIKKIKENELWDFKKVASLTTTGFNIGHGELYPPRPLIITKLFIIQKKIIILSYLKITNKKNSNIFFTVTDILYNFQKYPLFCNWFYIIQKNLHWKIPKSRFRRPIKKKMKSRLKYFLKEEYSPLPSQFKHSP